MNEQLFEKNSEIDNTMIFVEGVSDLVLLSLLLKEWNGYDYCCDIKIPNKLEGMMCSKYSNKESDLHIVSVGGIDNFSYAYNLMIPVVVSKRTKRCIFVIDNDYNDENITMKKLNIGVKLKANEWFTASIKDDYEDDKKMEFFIRIIPDDSVGAIESVLIDSMRDNEPEITKSSIDFVDGLSNSASKYINKNRLKLKAKVGVIFNLISPDTTFDSLTRKFKLIDFNNESILTSFGFLKVI